MQQLHNFPYEYSTQHHSVGLGAIQHIMGMQIVRFRDEHTD